MTIQIVKQEGRQLLQLLEKGEELALIDPNPKDIGFIVRMLSMISLPYRNPHTNEYERKNGDLSMLISTPKKFGGVPFGKYPRLLRIFIETEAYRTRSQTINIGRTLREFCNMLGITESGNTSQILANRAASFFGSTFWLTSSGKKFQLGAEGAQGFRPVDGWIKFWDKKHPDQKSLWDGFIKLTNDYFNLILDQPMPIDLRVVRNIQNSSLGLDIYAWLTGRFYTLQKPTVIHWEQLEAQFGSEYKRKRAFKSEFIKELKKVLAVYRDAKLRDVGKGLELFPSKPSIKPK